MSVSVDIARRAQEGATQLAVSGMFAHGDPDADGARMCLAEAGFAAEITSHDSRMCTMVARHDLQDPTELSALAALERALLGWRGEIIVARIPLSSLHLVAPMGAWRSLPSAFGDPPHWSAIADMWAQKSRAAVLPRVQHAMRCVAADARERMPAPSFVDVMFAG